MHWPVGERQQIISGKPNGFGLIVAKLKIHFTSMTRTRIDNSDYLESNIFILFWRKFNFVYQYRFVVIIFKLLMIKGLPWNEIRFFLTFHPGVETRVSQD